MTRTSPSCPTIQTTDTARPPRKRQGRPRDPDVEVNVLDAARRLTAEKGPDAWSMDELASVANVGKATIYRRWDSKEAVIWDAWLSIEFPRASSSQDDIRRELTELLLRLCRWHEDAGRPTVLSRILTFSRVNPEARRCLDEYLQRAEAPIKTVLQRAASAGQIAPDESCDAALDAVLDAVVGACVYQSLLRGRPVDADFVARLLDVVIRPRHGGSTTTADRSSPDHLDHPDADIG